VRLGPLLASVFSSVQPWSGAGKCQGTAKAGGQGAPGQRHVIRSLEAPSNADIAVRAHRVSVLDFNVTREVPVEEERLPASALRVAIASVRGAVHWGADDEHNNS